MLRWLSVAALGKPVVPANKRQVPRCGWQRAALLAAFACVAGLTGHSLATRGCISKQPQVQQSNAATYAYYTHTKTTTASPLVNWMLAGSPGRSQACRCSSSPARRPPSPIHRRSCQSSQPAGARSCQPVGSAQRWLHSRPAGQGSTALDCTLHSLSSGQRLAAQPLPDIECNAMRTTHLQVRPALAPRHAAAVAAHACEGGVAAMCTPSGPLCGSGCPGKLAAMIRGCYLAGRPTAGR